MRHIKFLPILLLFASCTKERLLVIDYQEVKKDSSTVVTNKLNGYKVNQAQLLINEVSYWKDCGVMWDIITKNFSVLPNGIKGANFMPHITVGDYNKDGWVDVFNSGTGSYGGKVVENCQWLIWNPLTNTFDNKNLFNNKITSFGANQRRTISIDLNKDGYTDGVIFDSGDDALNYSGPRPLQPIRIILSDGNGGYDLKEINNITPNLMYNHSGDVGDLNNDGNVDLVVATGSVVYISWGMATYPYFSSNITYFDVWDRNTFSEGGGGVINILIEDVNKDGWKDIIEGGCENRKSITPSLPFDLRNRILINNNGVFNKVIWLPFCNDNENSTISNDFKVLENGEIIVTGSINYDDYFFYIYIPNKNGGYAIEKNRFTYNINKIRKTGTTPGLWKPWLMLYDFDSDGIKDISYIDCHDFDKTLINKTVFLNKSNQYVEYDFYQYDQFCKSIMKKN